MNGIVYAFVLSEEIDWKLADEDLWNLEPIELLGQEKVLGHRKIDGAICKIIKTADNKLAAITK